MPNKIEEIIQFLTAAEETMESQVPNLYDFLSKIENYLRDIRDIFDQSFQLQSLSLGQVNSTQVFAGLSHLKTRLRALAAPHFSNSQPQIFQKIQDIQELNFLPGQEARYVYQAVKLDLWNRIINQRIYIPQGFIGIVNAAVLNGIAAHSLTAPKESLQTI